ncbi:THAP domain-containing protein 2-like [Anabrus simplex]|uniref:THAP domain-containing protein 2-like n=1 Tax=Anabrus simplex TaxID=316456 RepID=UPI0034DD812F
MDHSFPKDEALREKWIKAIRRKNYNPSKYAKLCSKHFTKDCFEICPWGRLKRLKEGAVPTIFDFESHPKNMKSKKSLKESAASTEDKIEPEPS